MIRRGTSSRPRYAPVLAVTPHHRAIVCVAFAAIGGTPVNNSAGNAINPPPPATEFSAPPSTPAKKRKMAWPKVKLKVYHERLPEVRCQTLADGEIPEPAFHKFPWFPLRASAPSVVKNWGLDGHHAAANVHTNRSGNDRALGRNHTAHSRTNTKVKRQASPRPA